ncbi:glutathione S-transferase family protein [Rhodospirillaceae bacterium KN72]|uniref:Glutathione S-transferase family protein n=1 Tax=Pacificispira spongiicola TaxID=2729598 RepID=A0A7Y0HGQ3_9PROT|nr:glutathione S-transferase family protein [Pacificispira spongiicola]NMM45187.1 glutathione S-transferase family protein [Pacificispira spongiicola]
MSLHLYGLPQSSMVWSVRLLLAEKGVPHTVGLTGCTELFEMSKSPDLDLHPLRKIPILEHDGKRLFEVTAIMRYIDRVFDGPRLLPDTPYEEGLADQWLSVIMAYVDPAAIRALVLPIVIGKMTGTPPEETAVTAATERTAKGLDVIDAALQDRNFFLGDTPCPADFALWPILHYLQMLPVGARLVKQRPALSSLMERVRARPGFIETVPT